MIPNVICIRLSGRGLFVLMAACALLVMGGCGNSNNSNAGDDSGLGAFSPECASHTRNGRTVGGMLTNGHCLYSTGFVDASNPLLENITLEVLANEGAHIFAGSLFVGGVFDTDQRLRNANIFKGGDGPILTLEAGARVAFEDNTKFLVINRGSQIIANGSISAPITLTSLTDIRGNLASTDVRQWGGVVINGFGVTNQCAYTGMRTFTSDVMVDDDTLELTASGCHVESEGSVGAAANLHGGNNNADNSGILNYVIVKHAGAQVTTGNELNGITFSAVGSGTRVNNIQIFSAFDDGIEIFGGAVNINNLLLVNVRDDSIDLDDGYVGTISNALIFQSMGDGNHCIEADGIGGYAGLDAAARSDRVARGLNTRAKIQSLTCIFTPNGDATATHDPGAGIQVREGMYAVIENSLIIGSTIANDTALPTDNYCLRADQAEAGLTELTLRATIMSCAEHQVSASVESTNAQITFERGVLYQSVTSGMALNPIATMDTGFQVLGMSNMRNVASLPIASSVLNGAVISPGTIMPVPLSGNPAPIFIGALGQGANANQFAAWTFGFFQ